MVQVGMSSESLSGICNCLVLDLLVPLYVLTVKVVNPSQRIYYGVILVKFGMCAICSSGPLNGTHLPFQESESLKYDSLPNNYYTIIKDNLASFHYLQYIQN